MLASRGALVKIFSDGLRTALHSGLESQPVSEMVKESKYIVQSLISKYIVQSLISLSS